MKRDFVIESKEPIRMLLQIIIKPNSHNLREASPAVVVLETSYGLTEELFTRQFFTGKLNKNYAKANLLVQGHKRI